MLFLGMPGKDKPWRRLMRRLRPRKVRQPVEVKDWEFVWPEDSDEPCDYEVNRSNVPRLGNNWIKTMDGCLRIQVDEDVKTVSVKLYHVNYQRVKSVEVNDGRRILFTAYDGGERIENGGYGPVKH